jgi:hypothetical protein
MAQPSSSIAKYTDGKSANFPAVVRSDDNRTYAVCFVPGHPSPVLVAP